MRPHCHVTVLVVWVFFFFTLMLVNLLLLCIDLCVFFYVVRHARSNLKLWYRMYNIIGLKEMILVSGEKGKCIFELLSFDISWTISCPDKVFTFSSYSSAKSWCNTKRWNMTCLLSNHFVYIICKYLPV